MAQVRMFFQSAIQTRRDHINAGTSFNIKSVVLHSRKKMTSVRIIRLSFLFSLLLPFFLPIMHDRYFYLADVLSIAYSFYVPKRFYLAIITPLTSFLSYMPFLFGNPTIELRYVAFAPLLVIVVVV